MTTHHCLHCDANVSTTEILDGWCENCGKKLPASMQAGLRPAPSIVAPAVNQLTELKLWHLLLGLAVFVVAVSSAFVLMKLV